MTSGNPAGKALMRGSPTRFQDFLSQRWPPPAPTYEAALSSGLEWAVAREKEPEGYVDAGKAVLRLRDIMTKDVATATPEMTIRDAITMLSDEHISGAPVVNGNKVIGIFSAGDILAYVAEIDDAQPEVSFRTNQTPLEEVTVSEIMTRDVKSLAPDCPIELAAAFMRHAQIHRVLVMDGGRLLGIATTTDLARAVAEHRFRTRTYVFA